MSDNITKTLTKKKQQSNKMLCLFIDPEIDASCKLFRRDLKEMFNSPHGGNNTVINI